MNLRPLLVVCLSCGWALAREIPAADAEALKGAFGEAQPGDVVVMADGVWKDAEIVFRANGTAEAPVTLKAQTPGKVILSGESSLRMVGSHLVVDGLLFRDGYIAKGHVVSFRGDSDELANDCRLTNCAIVDYNPPLESGEPSTWVSIYGARNRVDHCQFVGKNNGSPLLIVWLNGQPNDHRIDSNYFARRSFNGENGGETIRVGDSKTSMQVSRTIVESNLFEDCDGEVEIISSKSCENIYRHNTFRRNAGTLTLRHGNNCSVEANWFLGEGKPSSGGIRIIGEGHRIVNNYLAGLTGERFFSAVGFMACIPNSEPSGYLQIKNAVVAFNTVVNCRDSLYFGVGFGSRGRQLPVLGCMVANNVISNDNGPLVTVKVAPVNTTWEGNFFHGPAGDLPETKGVSTVNPLLEKGMDGIWLPGKDSPVLGAAEGDFSSVNTDIFGRPRDGRKDAGCFQASVAPVKWRPLSVNDVGPSWMKAQ